MIIKQKYSKIKEKLELFCSPEELLSMELWSKVTNVNFPALDPKIHCIWQQLLIKKDIHKAA